MLHRNFWAFTLPAMLVTLSYWYIADTKGISRTLVALQHIIPYLMIIPALVLSLMFRLSREFNLLLLLVIVLLVDKHLIWHNTPGLKINKDILFHAIAFLLPLNFILHNLLTEKGVLSLHGLKRITATLFQALALFLFLLLDYTPANQYLLSSLFAQSSVSIIPVSQLSLILFTFALIIITIRAIAKPTVMNITQVSVLVSAFLILYFSNNELQTLLFIGVTAFAILVGTILNSYNLAYIDELTGLPSRRVLRQDLLTLGKRYSIAMVDIDHFKKLNDNYGHDIGDQILRMVASRLRFAAGSNRIYRYGGEEFTILYPNHDINEATNKAIMTCERIAVKPFTIRSRKRPRKKPEIMTRERDLEYIHVTVSIGVAEKTAEHEKPQDTLNAADNALYRAKDAGRNCVAV